MKKLAFILLSLLVSCDHSDQYFQGTQFFLVNKQASMPVFVRGNVASGIFILFLHGGPGGTAIQKIGLPAFNSLEKSYATVFWDQRSSGSSQGNSPTSLLTLDQFVEDLDKLVDLIRYKYQNPKIFLMGHSWGGCLGTAYLTNAQRQNKIQGWIEVDGAHNNPAGDDLSLAWMVSYSQAQVAQNIDTEFWNYALNWYAKNPNFTSNQMEHYAFLEKANGYIHDPTVPRDPEAFPEYTFEYLFNSPADITMELTNYNTVIQNFIISDIDLTSQMQNIKIPSLILWGKYDGVIPFPMANQALQALGTDPLKKSIIQLPNSGHIGYYEDPGPFVNGVTAFIETYR